MWSPPKEFTKMTDEYDILLVIYRTQYRRHKQLDTLTMFSCFFILLAPLNITVTHTDTCSLLFYAISTLVRASKGRVHITYAGMSTQATPLRMLKILLQIFPSTFSESQDPRACVCLILTGDTIHAVIVLWLLCAEDGREISLNVLILQVGY